MIKRALTLIFTIALGAWANPKDYMVINKEDWTLGAIKLDVNFANGAFGSGFGILLDDGIIITSSAIVGLGFPSDISVKMKDKEADLIICIAKARLVASDTNAALALLKITGYTDDYCRPSAKKAYHRDLIASQRIDIYTTRKSALIESLAQESPFLIQNRSKTLDIEQGLPYFDGDNRLVGISSNKHIVKTAQIRAFVQFVKNEGLL